MKKIKHTSEYDNSEVFFDNVDVSICLSIGERTEWLSDEEGYPKLAYVYEIELGDRLGSPSKEELLMAIGVLEQIKKYLQKELCEMEKRGDAE